MIVKATQAVLLSQATWSEISSSIARITHLMICGTTLEIDAVDTFESTNDFVLEMKLLFFVLNSYPYFAFGSLHPFQSLWTRGAMSRRRR